MEKNEKINEVIREHETSVPWERRREAALFYGWFDRFNERLFEGRLRIPAIHIDRVRRDCAGWYLSERNAEGVQHEMMINTTMLQRPVCEQLALLLHLMVHEWQFLRGHPRKANYHNKEFCRKAKEVGIPCEVGYRGVILAYLPPFTDLLREHGVEVAEGPIAPAGGSAEEPENGEATWKRWECACGQIIFGGSKVRARCAECGQPFVRAVKKREKRS